MNKAYCAFMHGAAAAVAGEFSLYLFYSHRAAPNIQLPADATGWGWHRRRKQWPDTSRCVRVRACASFLLMVFKLRAIDDVYALMHGDVMCVFVHVPYMCVYFIKWQVHWKDWERLCILWLGDGNWSSYHFLGLLIFWLKCAFRYAFGTVAEYPSENVLQ